MDDELLARAEEALTEIKVAQGLSERHEAVLAALRIRLKGRAGKSLEEMLEAADDSTPDRLGEAIGKTEGERKPSLDDLLARSRNRSPTGPPEALGAIGRRRAMRKLIVTTFLTP